MAKKRVYELAKDLGLSNKEMVDWLRAHEYDVKSHSSSLEDDQALAVVEKFKGEKGTKVEPPKPSGSGVVLRRKEGGHRRGTRARGRSRRPAVSRHLGTSPRAPVEVRKPEPPRVAPPEPGRNRRPP